MGLYFELVGVVSETTLVSLHAVLTNHFVCATVDSHGACPSTQVLTAATCSDCTLVLFGESRTATQSDHADVTTSATQTEGRKVCHVVLAVEVCVNAHATPGTAGTVSHLCCRGTPCI